MKDSGFRYGQNVGKERRRIINGMHQLYHQIPALCAQTINYLSFVTDRRTDIQIRMWYYL